MPIRGRSGSISMQVAQHTYRQRLRKHARRITDMRARREKRLHQTSGLSIYLSCLYAAFIKRFHQTSGLTTSQSHRGVVVWTKNQHACAKTRGSFVDRGYVLPVSLRGCLFLLFGSTLVVKIKKTQESTPIILVMPKKNNRDKEKIILPFFYYRSIRASR
jgi:hypothetical protein